MMRRMIISIILVFLDNLPSIQIMIFLQMNVFMVIEIAKTQILDGRKNNRTDLTNEVFTQIATYHVIIFSDFCNNPSFQFYIGYSLALTVIFTAFYNLSFIVKDLFRGCFAKNRRNKKLKAFKI